MKKGLIILLCSILITAIGFGGYVTWAYNNPKQMSFSKGTPNDKSTDLYREDYFLGWSYRLWFKTTPEGVHNKIAEVDDKLSEVRKDISDSYTAPMHITANGKVENGKTIFIFSGTATQKSDGKTVEYNKEIVFDFVLTDKFE